jgi:carboxylate-amine ligase
MASEFTVGVEEEYQLVDAESGALHSRAREVLATSWSGELRPELQETTLEIGTRICSSVAELDRELRRLRFEAAIAAAAEDLTIVAAGTHPFSRWEEYHLTATGRYAMIVERYRRIALDEHNFGMHVHVGIPAGLDRIVLLNAVRAYIPHLIALAASSPFYEGEDSGFASYRMVLWRRWPNAGMPPRLASSQEYRGYIELLLRTDAISDERGLYWGVRPHSIYPTLEFRVTDICPRLDDAVSITALIRALVAAAACGRLEERQRGPFSEGAEHALLSNNEWLATRFGLDAWVMDPTLETGRVPMRIATPRLLDRVYRTAEELGDGAALARVELILERGNGADHMRHIAEESGLDAVTRWLIGETVLGTGLDRRRTQRPPFPLAPTASTG